MGFGSSDPKREKKTNLFKRESHAQAKLALKMPAVPMWGRKQEPQAIFQAQSEISHLRSSCQGSPISPNATNILRRTKYLKLPYAE